MTAILLAGSSPAELGLTSATPTGTTSRFDPNFTKVGSYTYSAAMAWTREVKIDPTVKDIWFHARRFNNSNYSEIQSTDIFCGIYNAAGTAIAHVRGTGSRKAATRVIGSSTVTGSNSSGAFPDANTTHVTLDVHLWLDSGANTINAELFVNGVSESSASVAGAAAAGPITSFRFSNIGRSINAGWEVLSEVILTEGIPTVGLRLAQLMPNADGYHTDMVGSYADLDPADDSTYVVATAAEQRQTWVPSIPAGVAGASALTALIEFSTTSRLPDTEFQAGQALRVDGTDYDAPPMDNFVQRPDFRVWWVNPDTGNPWSAADLANLEIGLYTQEEV